MRHFEPNSSDEAVHGQQKNEEHGVHETFKCPFPDCSKQLRSKGKLLNHIRRKGARKLSEKSPLTCQSCFQVFVTNYDLNAHVKAVHDENKLPMCEICEIHFESSADLACHASTIHFPVELPYRCPACDFSSSRYSDTWKHFRSLHSDGGHMLCFLCLRGDFSSIEEFGQHMKYHMEADANFKCTKCRLQFFSLHERDQHLKQDHISDEQCAKGSSSVAVVGGINDKEALISCNECNTMYSNTHAGITRHFSLTTKICSHCSYQSNCYNAFTNHQKTQHRAARKSQSLLQKATLKEANDCFNRSDFGDPKMPLDLCFLKVLATSVVVAWRRPPGPIENYKLVFLGKGIQTTKLLPSKTHHVKLVGLKSKISYKVKLSTQYGELESKTATAEVTTLSMKDPLIPRPLPMAEYTISDDDEMEVAEPLPSQ